MDAGRLGVTMSVSGSFPPPSPEAVYPSICPPGRNNKTAHMVLFNQEREDPDVYTPPLERSVVHGSVLVFLFIYLF